MLLGVDYAVGICQALTSVYSADHIALQRRSLIVQNCGKFASQINKRDTREIFAWRNMDVRTRLAGVKRFSYVAVAFNLRSVFAVWQS